MNFFYDLNKQLNSIGAVPESTQLNERDLGKQLNEISTELVTKARDVAKAKGSNASDNHQYVAARIHNAQGDRLQAGLNDKLRQQSKAAALASLSPAKKRLAGLDEGAASSSFEILDTTLRDRISGMAGTEVRGNNVSSSDPKVTARLSAFAKKNPERLKQGMSEGTGQEVEKHKASEWLQDPRLKAQVSKLHVGGIAFTNVQKGVTGEDGGGMGNAKDQYTNATNPMYFKEFLTYLIKNAKDPDPDPIVSGTLQAGQPNGAMAEGFLGFGMPKFSVTKPYKFDDTGRLEIDGSESAGEKVMAKLQKINPQLAAQGRHIHQTGRSGVAYFGIDFPTMELAQQAAQALGAPTQQGMSEATGDEKFDSMMGNIVDPALKAGNTKFEQLYDRVELKLLESGIHSYLIEDIEDILKEFRIKPTDKLLEKLESTFYDRGSDVLGFYDDIDESQQGMMEAKGKKPDFLDLDKDGDKKESMKKAAADKKKNPFKKNVAEDTGDLKQEIKELEKLARHLSGEPSQTDPETGNGYRPNYIKTVRKIEKLKAQLKSQKDMSEDSERKTTHGTEVTKGNITTHTRNYEPDVEDDDDFNAEPRKAGRPKGTKHATGAKGPTGKSKLQNLKAIREEGDTCPHCGSKMVMGSHDEKPAKKVGVTQSVPKKVKEADAAPAAEKAPSNKYGFGKGIYDSLNRQVDNLITEGMSVTVNMTTDDTGQPHKDITVHADGDDAAKLAELLNLAGIHQSEQSCSSCGQSPCGCGGQMVDENSPSNAPDTVFASVDQVAGPQYGGGPNAPHVMINPADPTFNPPGDMGQSTVNAGPGASRVPGTTNENKQADLGMSLYKELQQFKGK